MVFDFSRLSREEKDYNFNNPKEVLIDIVNRLENIEEYLQEREEKEAETAEQNVKKRGYYLSKFLSLTCSPDVLLAVNPLNRPAKEISESMAIIKRVKRFVFDENGEAKNPDYTLYDLCAGNALTSVISAHLLPIKNNIAIDQQPRDRHYERVRKFEYRKADIFELEPDYFDKGSIIIGVHPCIKLAERVVELYNKSQAEHLVLMPCCQGGIEKQYGFTKEYLGGYLAWCFQLACNSEGGILEVDENVLSPKNGVITASKNK